MNQNIGSDKYHVAEACFLCICSVALKVTDYVGKKLWRDIRFVNGTNPIFI